MAECLRAPVSTGVAGWRDDDLAFISPWDFDVSQVRGPVAIWQGDQDRMVPFGHGRWLTANVADALSRLRPGEGHLSIAVTAIGEIVDDLIDLIDLTG
jgi:pimeloyl-ACP methyl ester carboxylesterase